MKRVITFLSVLLTATFGFGQSYEGAVEFQKKLQPAAVIELQYAPSLVDAAMNDYLQKKGRSKNNDIKGFTAFRNAQPVQNDSANADLYFKTERKSRKEKEVTVISLLVKSRDLQNAADSLHHMDMEAAKIYLNNLAMAIDAYNLEVTIKEQNEAVTKAESKYKNLSSDGDELIKKRSELDKKIEDNKIEVQAQMKEVENQKLRLAQWVSQRKS